MARFLLSRPVTPQARPGAVLARCGRDQITTQAAVAPALAMPWAIALAALCVSCLCLASAVESTDSVVAVPHPDGTGDLGFRCGGSAVVIAPGLAITLVEAVADPESDEVHLQFGERHIIATVSKRGETTGALLLAFDATIAQPAPAPVADSKQCVIGDVVWSVGNSYGILEQDGVHAVSRGIISGMYAIPSDSPPVRGRGGKILSEYRGLIFETDAAINDGNQGGALFDQRGQLIALASAVQARERRLGAGIPIHIIYADLNLPLPTAKPTPSSGIERTLADHAAQVAKSTALVYFERPTGPGNPPAMPRPRTITRDIPAYLAERMQQEWDFYYHQQQIFYTDQAISAIVIDSTTLITAASNLHGAPTRGRVLTEAGPVDCTIVAIHAPLDFAVLRTAQPLPFPAATFPTRLDVACGDPVAIIGRHRSQAGYTMTTGVVSATERRNNQGEFFLHQTDAMANYGNLGGPVMNDHGEVIGMVSFLGPQNERPWHVNSGVAPFTDSDSIQKALPTLIAGTSVRSSRTVGLGVQLDDSSTKQGLRIVKVFDDTGAAEAKLQSGDIILEINGNSMHAIADATRALVRHREGQEVTLRIQRNQEELRVKVTLRTFGPQE